MLIDLLKEFKTVNQKLFSQLETELTLKTTNILNSTLLSKAFLESIKITIQCGFPYKMRLLFRGTEHGMNFREFWNRCKNQGPTLIVCKSFSGTVFGGYTPCKWAEDKNYQQDQSKTSFLFNQNRQEFYPLINPQYAIYSSSSGLIFGDNVNCDLYISSDFKKGHSFLGRNYQVRNRDQIKEFNLRTYLMGSEQPDLVEMEVYLLENGGSQNKQKQQ